MRVSIEFALCMGGQDGYILAKFLLFFEQGQYPAILTEQAWSIKDLLYGKTTPFSCGTQRVIPSGKDSAILPTRIANHSVGLVHFAYSQSELYNEMSDHIHFSYIHFNECQTTYLL